MQRPSMMSLAATVLKNPASLFDAADDREDLAWIVPRLLAIALIGTAVFGAVVGSYRGGIQMAYAAMKMPVFFLVPLVVGLPAVRAIYQSCELDVPWRRLAMAGLTGLARTGVLAAALGPILWLAYSVEFNYHVATLVLAASVAVLGLPALFTVTRAITARNHLRWLATGGSILMLGLICAQTGWLLRPFVARPTAEVAFLRPVEEDVFSSLAATARSSMGDYYGWEAEATGLIGRAQDSRSDVGRQEDSR